MATKTTSGPRSAATAWIRQQRQFLGSQLERCCRTSVPIGWSSAARAATPLDKSEPRHQRVPGTMPFQVEGDFLSNADAVAESDRVGIPSVEVSGTDSRRPGDLP